MITRKEDVLKYGSMIERESERLLFLINDIIRLSEIEEHTEELRHRWSFAPQHRMPSRFWRHGCSRTTSMWS